MELDKELAETVDHACQVGGNGHYMRLLMEPLRNEHKALQVENKSLSDEVAVLSELLEGGDISRASLIEGIEAADKKADTLVAALDKATREIAKLQKKKKGR